MNNHEAQSLLYQSSAAATTVNEATAAGTSPPPSGRRWRCALPPRPLLRMAAPLLAFHGVAVAATAAVWVAWVRCTAMLDYVSAASGIPVDGEVQHLMKTWWAFTALGTVTELVDLFLHYRELRLIVALPRTEDLTVIPVAAVATHLRLLGKCLARCLFMVATLGLRELFTLGVMLQFLSLAPLSTRIVAAEPGPTPFPLPLPAASLPQVPIAIAITMYGWVAGLKVAALLELPTVFAELDRVQAIFTFATLRQTATLTRAEYGADVNSPLLHVAAREYPAGSESSIASSSKESNAVVARDLELIDRP
ncbi:hypothetical protein H9P43_000385 [Blastocladiella emersonii ATCC 22665]|nr:hypothetical protein H9P43_000385 [Blastocladiella emersonii ATCC 22665]